MLMAQPAYGGILRRQFANGAGFTPPTSPLINISTTTPAVLPPATASTAATIGGGVIPLPVQNAPYVAPAPKAAPMIDMSGKAPWIIGGVVLLLLFILFLRR